MIILFCYFVTETLEYDCTKLRLLFKTMNSITFGCTAFVMIDR